MNEIAIGSIVVSTAGRDEGNAYIVVSQSGDFVSLADGKARTMANLKKKRIKHLKPTGIKVEAIADKLNTNKKVFDSEIYSAIKKSM